MMATNPHRKLKRIGEICEGDRTYVHEKKNTGRIPKSIF